MSTDLDARRAALGLILGVLEDGEMIDPRRLPSKLDGPARARALSLARATFRWRGAAETVLRPLMKRAPKPRIAALLHLALIEIKALGAAPHGVVDAAVSIAKKDRKTADAAGFINAVLRKASDAEWPSCSPLPQPFAKALRSDWGKAAVDEIASSLTNEPPLDVTAKADADRWAESMGGALTPSGSIRLKRPGAVTALPGFEEGAWWVQDAAAAIPAKLAGAGDGRAALDLCAAPGGKTMQLAAARWRVTAVDASEARLKRLSENLTRTGLSARTVAADASGLEPGSYDLVLLDAPCSATGTIRRHPELPWLRGNERVDALVGLQKRLIEAAWSQVAPGGTLIYCVCSLAKAEGEGRIRSFLAEHSDASRVPLTPAETGDAALINNQGDFRSRPDQWRDIGGLDGFFAARLARAS